MVVNRVEAEGDDQTAYPATHHGDGSVFRLLIPDRRRWCGVSVGGVGIHVFVDMVGNRVRHLLKHWCLEHMTFHLPRLFKG
jgi:hypothetical protein